MATVIEVEIFNKLFSSIAEEMGIILAKSAFSPNIKERRDFSCAIFDHGGELIAQAAHIPVHLGAMPMTLNMALREIAPGPGDVIMVNDPFRGGSHLPDITLIAGVFDRDYNLLFYVVNRAHHADVGGRHPGSMGMVTSLDDEGVRVPPTLLQREGRINHSFLDQFLASVRNPVERQGDLRAQLAALQRGRNRLLDLAAKYSMDRLNEAMEQLKAYAERLMRHAIGRIPDGTYTFTDSLDNDGRRLRVPLPISVRLSIDGDRAVADFSDTCDQVATPMNTVEAVTVSAAVYVFQCLVGEGFPINHGSYQPLQIITRPGSLVHAVPPAPMAAGNVETSQRIVDVLLGALARALPDTIPAASCGSMNNVAIGGIDRRNDRQFAYYETIAGGMGGRPSGPGLSAIHTHMTNTMNTPVEALEHAYPMRIERYAIRRGSGGDGKHRGGDGITRSYRFIGEAEVSLLADRQRLAPYGLAEGMPGRPGRSVLIRKKRKKALPGKINFTTRPGDLLVIETPGGGGWGKG